MAAEPALPPVAEPAPTSNLDTLTTNDALMLGGAAGLGLLLLAGAAIAAHRRKRRREDAEFEARQQLLDQLEAEHEAEPATLELNRSAEVRPGPAFVRATPKHDPVPERTAFVASPNGAPHDADFLIRRASKPTGQPVEQD
jgi:hypothetical protein